MELEKTDISRVIDLFKLYTGGLDIGEPLFAELRDLADEEDDEE